MFKKIKWLYKAEDGAYALLTALMMTVMLSFCAAAVDLGAAYSESSSLQAALDAGALAGAYELPNTAAAQQAALEYVQTNGYGADEVTVEFSNGDKTITLHGSTSTETTFLNILGINKLDVAEVAAAEKTREIGGVFAYRIFSGNTAHTFSMGGRFTINGSVHSNGSLSISPSYGLITGSAEACNTLYVNQWTATVGLQVPNARYIAMPDFTDSVNSVMPSSYTVTTSAATLNAAWWKQTWNDDMYVTGNVSVSNGVVINGDVYIDGNLTINGGAPVCVLNGNLYVHGNIDFNNSVEVYGCVFATGTINFRGGSMQVNPSIPICVYSENGSINIQTAASETTGIIYAPKGSISIAGGTTRFNGSIVADKVMGIPADLIVGESSIDFPFLQGEPRIHLVR